MTGNKIRPALFQRAGSGATRHCASDYSSSSSSRPKAFASKLERVLPLQGYTLFRM